MRSFSVRRAVSACVLSAAAAAALAAPGAASAAGPESCSGGNTKGAGASTQKAVQLEIWNLKFNLSADPKACNGTQGSKGKPTLTYESVGSGAGLEKWGVNAHAFEAGTYGFVATDEPVDPTEKAEIEGNQTTKTAETVQTIPVLQVAIAVPVNLPAGCVATSTQHPGQLAVSNVTLEKIYRGTINTWAEVLTAEASNKSGDKITGEGCVTGTQITRVVRKDQSGTSHIFKKYLSLTSSTPFLTNLGNTKDWKEIAEGVANETEWPAGSVAVVRPAAAGGGELVAKVAATPSSIGYASLVDVRKNGSFSQAAKSGGPNTAKFWLDIENNGKPGVAAKGIKSADPSTNGDAEAKASANCAKEKYTNGSGTKFPPKTTGLTWNEVTTEVKQANYPICGLTYDMGLSKYSAYPGTSEGEAITANNYLQFEVSTGAEGGQSELVNQDYEPLPKNLVKIAQKGAALVAN